MENGKKLNGFNNGMDAFDGVGGRLGPFGDTTTTSIFTSQFEEKTLITANVNEDHVEMIYRLDSNLSQGFMRPQPRIIKEIIRSVNNKMVVTKTIEGKYIPSQTEGYEFPNE